MPTPSFILGFGAILSTLSSPVFAATYLAQDTYTGANWLEGFKFETKDTNHGFVNYADETTAKNAMLYRNVGTDIYFGVDYTTPLTTGATGRKSVRLEGKKNYNQGLFVLDIKHMPSAQCGTWPAFWSLGQEPWTVNGEVMSPPRHSTSLLTPYPQIDIIEGVNRNTVNEMVLHTATTCSVSGRDQTAPQKNTDCAYDTGGSGGYDVDDTRPLSYGDAFNANAGGYYVMEWTDAAIKIWFFPRGTQPASLLGATPDTATLEHRLRTSRGTVMSRKAFWVRGSSSTQTVSSINLFIYPTLKSAPDMCTGRMLTTAVCGDWAGNVYA